MLITPSGSLINTIVTPLGGLLPWDHLARGKLFRQDRQTLALLYLGGCTGRGRRRRASRLFGRDHHLDDIPK